MRESLCEQYVSVYDKTFFRFEMIVINLKFLDKVDLISVVKVSGFGFIW